MLIPVLTEKTCSPVDAYHPVGGMARRYCPAAELDAKMEATIEITLSGHKETVSQGTSLSQLIAQFDEGDTHLIVEHNGRFVYPQDYDTTVVRPGDRIEFINPNFGG
jgi:thiamine biosynthesis protein ThiS